jgi:D-aminopeptidase
LGLYRHLYRGIEVIHHSGSVIGGNSQMLTVPSQGLDIAIMVNGAPCNATATAWKIVDTMLEHDLGPAPRHPHLRRYSKMAGTRYHGKSGALIGFGGFGADDEAQLGLSFNGSVPLPVLWEDEKRLYAGWDDVALGPLEFQRDEIEGEGEPPATLTYRESGRVETLRRVDCAPADLPISGRAIVGRYRSHDLNAEADITLEGEDLWFAIRGDCSPARRLKLKAWSAEAYEIADPEHPAGALFALTAERVGDTVPRFRIDGIRARKVAFERI